LLQVWKWLVGEKPIITHLISGTMIANPTVDDEDEWEWVDGASLD
jgi:hypothetical protein